MPKKPAVAVLEAPESNENVTTVFANQIEVWPLDRFVLYERNPRRHSNNVIDRMAQSLRKFGFPIPVLARKSNGEVIDGHLRLKGARRAKLTEAPFIDCDGWTPEQVKAFRLLANRSVNWAEWDDDLLTSELADLKDFNFDLNLTGFDTDEIEGLLYSKPLVTDYAPEDSSFKGMKQLSVILTQEQWTVVERVMNQVIEAGHAKFDGNDHQPGNAVYYLAKQHATR